MLRTTDAISTQVKFKQDQDLFSNVWGMIFGYTCTSIPTIIVPWLAWRSASSRDSILQRESLEGNTRYVTNVIVGFAYIKDNCL